MKTENTPEKQRSEVLTSWLGVPSLVFAYVGLEVFIFLTSGLSVFATVTAIGLAITLSFLVFVLVVMEKAHD